MAATETKSRAGVPTMVAALLAAIAITIAGRSVDAGAVVRVRAPQAKRSIVRIAQPARMRRVVNIGEPLVVTTTTPPVSATATTIEAAAGSPEARLGAAALALVRVDYRNRFPGWTIAFLPRRENLLGMTRVTERRVEIYVRPERPVEGIAHDIAHELGHVVDVLYNTSSTRNRYLSIRDLAPTTPWWTCNGCRDMQVGAGDFAETFAAIAGPKFRFYGELGVRPPPDMLAAVVEVLPANLLTGPSAGPKPAEGSGSDPQQVSDAPGAQGVGGVIGVGGTGGTPAVPAALAGAAATEPA